MASPSPPATAAFSALNAAAGPSNSSGRHSKPPIPLKGLTSRAFEKSADFSGCSSLARRASSSLDGVETQAPVKGSPKTDISRSGSIRKGRSSSVRRVSARLSDLRPPSPSPPPFNENDDADDEDDPIYLIEFEPPPPAPPFVELPPPPSGAGAGACPAHLLQPSTPFSAPLHRPSVPLRSLSNVSRSPTLAPDHERPDPDAFDAETESDDDLALVPDFSFQRLAFEVKDEDEGERVGLSAQDEPVVELEERELNQQAPVEEGLGGQAEEQEEEKEDEQTLGKTPVLEGVESEEDPQPSLPQAAPTKDQPAEDEEEDDPLTLFGPWDSFDLFDLVERPRSPSPPAAPLDIPFLRYSSSLRLLTTWEDIGRRYVDRPEEDEDEIDLWTGEIVRDRGALRGLKGSVRVGDLSGRQHDGKALQQAGEEEETGEEDGEGSSDEEGEEGEEGDVSAEEERSPTSNPQTDPRPSRMGDPFIDPSLPGFLRMNPAELEASSHSDSKITTGIPFLDTPMPLEPPRSSIASNTSSFSLGRRPISSPPPPSPAAPALAGRCFHSRSRTTDPSPSPADLDSVRTARPSSSASTRRLAATSSSSSSGSSIDSFTPTIQRLLPPRSSAALHPVSRTGTSISSPFARFSLATPPPSQVAPPSSATRPSALPPVTSLSTSKACPPAPRPRSGLTAPRASQPSSGPATSRKSQPSCSDPSPTKRARIQHHSPAGPSASKSTGSRAVVPSSSPPARARSESVDPLGLFSDSEEPGSQQSFLLSPPAMFSPASAPPPPPAVASTATTKRRRSHSLSLSSTSTQQVFSLIVPSSPPPRDRAGSEEMDLDAGLEVGEDLLRRPGRWKDREKSVRGGPYPSPPISVGSEKQVPAQGQTGG